MDPAHVSHHAIHGDIARHHRFQIAILLHRHGKRDHQLPGPGINVGCRYHRAVRAHHLLIPGTNGGVIIRRDACRVGEFRRLAGVAHVNVGETARLGKLLKHRNRIVSQRDALRGGNHRHFAFDPVGNRHVVAGAGAGQNIALGVLVILARDLEVNYGIEKKGDDEAACRRGDNACANGSEHK